jgi:hypothetical protein
MVIINSNCFIQDTFFSSKLTEIRWDDRLIWWGCLRYPSGKNNETGSFPTKIYFTEKPQFKQIAETYTCNNEPSLIEQKID